MSVPSVSIIMGIYNCENTIARSIDSIIHQSFKNWELIMCDDYSTDNTYHIAKDYSRSFKNIILIENNKNYGLAYSLNRCLDISKGKYIARMDGDDQSLSKRLQIQ